MLEQLQAQKKALVSSLVTVNANIETLTKKSADIELEKFHQPTKELRDKAAADEKDLTDQLRRAFTLKHDIEARLTALRTAIGKLQRA